jgi:flagellar protein FlaF
MSLDAYQRTRRMIENPRAAEHRLMSQITGEMMTARDAGLSGAALMPALHRNREVWRAFVVACGMPGNQLSADLRAGIISLGLWVDRFTSAVVAGQEPVDELISINRQVMDGLSGSEAIAA